LGVAQGVVGAVAAAAAGPGAARAKRVAFQAAPYLGGAAVQAAIARPDLAAQYAGQAVGAVQAAPGVVVNAGQAAGCAVAGAALGVGRGGRNVVQGAWEGIAGLPGVAQGVYDWFRTRRS
jgi:hypothetical protein